MAIEARRGCGYRKIGGLYLVGSGAGQACDRLPIALTICPTCKAGIHQSRGWTWINIHGLVGGPHKDCKDKFPCPLCTETEQMGEVGLLWIGERFYRTPGEFMAEGAGMGISRRIAAIPRGFKVGQTWVLLAHRKTGCQNCAGSGWDGDTKEACVPCKGNGHIPGIFYVFRPTRLEKIVKQSDYEDAEAMDSLRKRGITPVPVPDNDTDHRGSVFDKEES